ncbi:hypothetical protein EYZ11_007324 [Aspergillus tanneri]|uniref:Uncharacterized protein n=1 Tax=Aspergillus tanneri TaxID=1220188 RepID=A0A4S3JFJ0_9EURO|nr:uncharacterized protein ATNIH1004_004259 [Aspergillus tanneri]KAA8648374.1 hypothetical protein ATNIH1004_004259 [Aspergillus tanneri]THC93197.1 hypothetical protein EYZ11_007324 [Aspergillus tanneri]
MANATNSTVASAVLSPSDTAMLEAFIPGYPFISRFLVSYLHIDPAQYVPYLLTGVILIAAFKYSFGRLRYFIEEYCLSKAEIRLDDEIYNYVMFWLAQQPFTKRTNHFVAGTKTSRSGRYYDSSDEEDESDDDEYDSDGNVVVSFDEYWAKAKNRDKYKRLLWTPAEGTHYFWFRGRLLAFMRVRDDNNNNNSSWYSRLVAERLYLKCLGRDPTILKELLCEAQRAYVAKNLNSTLIYRGQKSPGEYVEWERCMAKAPRPLSTVVLAEERKQEFIDDIKEYLHPRTRRWYSNRGIPYRRGYLFHGPPGTGKTSLCFAASGVLGLGLYLLNLSSKSFDEDDLMSLFHDLPRRCIVLLEDVDCAGITQNRDSKDSSEPDKTKHAADPNSASETGTSNKHGVSLSGLLNVIDGVAASEGRILVMTTNHPEKLDSALLRPGRVDMSVEFRYAEPNDIQDLFSAIYSSLEGEVRLPKGEANEKKQKGLESSRMPWNQFSRERVQELASEFASCVPAGEFTAAEIQGFLLNHKADPEAAIRGADEWVQNTRSKRQEKENPLAASSV